jgi:hypothetical protein
MRLSAQLPQGWKVEVQPWPSDRPSSVDAMIQLSTPGGESVEFAVAVKRWITAPTSVIASVLAALQRTTDKPVLLSHRLHECAIASGVRGAWNSYLDSTGWVYVYVENPAVFIVLRAGIVVHRLEKQLS